MLHVFIDGGGAALILTDRYHETRTGTTEGCRVSSESPSSASAASASQASETAPAVPTAVDAARVVASVKRVGLRYFIDDEGDVGIPWRYVTAHVIFQDTRAVQVRGAWQRVADTEHLADLRALVEDWNTTRIGPKAYLTVSDTGAVRLHGETTYPLAAGMTDAQLDDFILDGCRLIVALMRHAETTFPDPLRGRLEP